jgi:hypothetical protein
MWLCKQGLHFRGHDESDNANLESNMNKSFNYLSPTIQNEMIEIISKQIIKKIIPSEFKYFAIMVDETMDMAKHEQMLQECCNAKFN